MREPRSRRHWRCTMPDLREELGRLADEVGEPVSFGDLEDARRRRERRRRVSSVVVALVVIAAVGAFFAATYRGAPIEPAGVSISTRPSPSAQPSSSPHGSLAASQQPSLVAPRCSFFHPQIVGDGHQLVGCEEWAAGNPLELTFKIETPGTVMALALYPARNCDA